MKGRLPILLPWLLLVFVAGAIFWDRLRPREEAMVEEAASASDAAPAGKEAGGPVAQDPVCSMEVAKSTAYRVETPGGPVHFCSLSCRDAYLAEPPRFAKRDARPAAKHMMRGIPTWMFQAGAGIVLVVSFGFFELLPSRRRRREKDPGPAGLPARPAGLAARLDLTAWRPLRSLLAWPLFIPIARAVVAVLFLLVIAAGLFGNQSPAMNMAPLLTWTIWWAGLVFLVLYLGKAWCTICPWDAIATWIERLRFRGPRRSGLSLGLPWPKALRNIWFAVGLFLLLTWVELGMGITLVPRATAYVGLGILGLAIACALLFDRKAFCRYGCLVGRVSGLYALFSGLELRASDPAVCASCRTMDCYRGNEKGDGCPTFQFPRTMDVSTYCTLCTECVRTCPHQNIAVRMRPWGADLAGPGKARADEAFLALALLAMTSFHGVTMTPQWTRWTAALETSFGISGWTAFSLLMLAFLALPVLAYALLVRAAAWTSRAVSARSLFVQYAYALLPIALFYHLAHNAEHFLMEGPKVVPLLSDPFGWGWNLLGTAAWKMAPLLSLEGLWPIQVGFVVVGHVYSLWIAQRITRRLVSSRRSAILGQIPILLAMVLASAASLWLLAQPMEMRVSAM